MTTTDDLLAPDAFEPFPKRQDPVVTTVPNKPPSPSDLPQAEPATGLAGIPAAIVGLRIRNFWLIVVYWVRLRRRQTACTVRAMAAEIARATLRDLGIEGDVTLD